MQTLGAGETVRAEELVLAVPDGRSVRTLINATPIRAEGGGVGSVVVTMQDLAPLDEIERMRTKFLGLVSHELRAPADRHQGLGRRGLLEEAAEHRPGRNARNCTGSTRPLVEQEGDDLLWGGRGDDMFVGRDDDDTWIGGSGARHIIRGRGVDTP